MAINLTESIGKHLPDALAKRAVPLLRITDQLANGSDNSVQSQRIAIIIFMIRVASAVIAFLSQVLLARWLGSFEYGIFVAVWVGVMVLATLAGFGFPSAAIRFVAEYGEKQKPGLQRGIIKSSVLISFVASSLMAAVGAWILYNFTELVTQYFVIPIYLAAICLPMISLPGVLDGISRAFNWPKIAFVPTYIVRPVGILAVMGIALLLGYPASAKTAMWSAIIATYVTTAGQLVSLYLKLEQTLPPANPEYKIRYWVLTAMPMFLVEGFYYVQTSVDILFVSMLMRPEDTAVYFASAKVLALVHFVYFAVRAAVSHRYSAYHASGKISEFKNFVQKTVTWTFWPSLLLAIFMMVFGKYFLLLFGSEFTVGESLIWILAIGIVIRSSVGPAEALLMMTERQKACAGIYAATLFVNIALNFSLIPIYGLHGAAIATTLALAFESMALHVAARKTLGIHAFIIPQKAEQAHAAGAN